MSDVAATPALACRSLIHGAQVVVDDLDAANAVVRTRVTPHAPAPLMDDRLALAPDGTVAVIARTADAKAYACVNFGAWVPLGRTNQNVCAGWDGDFRFGIVGPGGAELVEYRVAGSFAVEIGRGPTRPGGVSTGVLDFDPLERRFVLTDERFHVPVVVGPYRLLKAVRRLGATGWWWLGQETREFDKLQVVAGDGTFGWVAEYQWDRPALGATADRLYTNTQAFPFCPRPAPVSAGVPQWVGYFFEASKRYGSRLGAGNCAVVVEGGLRAAVPAGKKVFLAPVGDDGTDLVAEWRSEWHRVAGLYCAAEAADTADALEAVVAQARARVAGLGLGRRVCVAYAGRRVWPEVSAEAWCVEAYQDPGEALATAAARWREQKARVRAARKRVVVVSGDFDRLGRLSEAQLLAAQPEYDRLSADAWARWRFSHGRPGGTRDHQVLLSAHNAYWRAQAPPAIEVPPAPPDPEPPDPPTTPEPPIMTSLTLRAQNGMYVRALDDQPILRADAPAANAWERFEVHQIGGGKVALRTAHGKFVTAEGGGGGALVCNRPYTLPEETAGWEHFHVLNTSAGGVVLRTENGHYWCAEEGGGGEVNATRQDVGIWETFNGPQEPSRPPSPTPGPVPPGTYRGPLGQTDRVLTAGGAIYRPVGVSAFTLGKKLVDGDEAAFDRYVDFHASYGVDLYRIFLTGKGWNEVSPQRGLETLPAVLEKLKARGAYALVTVITGSKRFKAENGFTDWRWVALNADAICRAAGNAVLEGANEYPHSSQSDAVHNAQNIRDWFKGVKTPWAVGAARGGNGSRERPNTDEPLQAGGYPGKGGTMCTAHLDRSRDFWDNVRRLREIYAIHSEHHVPAWDSEREGAGQAEDGRMWDPVFFLAAGVLDRCFDLPSVHHQDCGLECALPNATELACLKGYVRGVRDVIDTPAILQYQNAGHVGQGSPIKAFSNATRCYSFVSGGKGYTVVLGGGDDTAIEWANGYRPVQVLVDEQAVHPEAKKRRLIVHRISK